MQGIKRKFVYVVTFEAIAIAFCTLAFSAISDKSVGHAGILSVATSAIAVLWNFAFTSTFEAWERHQTTVGRSIRRRVAQAVLFEAGLIVLLVPVIAWWLDMHLWRAFVMNLGLVAFFLIYAFCFSWCFDRVFGLPASVLKGQAS